MSAGFADARTRAATSAMVMIGLREFVPTPT